eukprot:116074-Ditylum_brightwellii.AAC.1
MPLEIEDSKDAIDGSINTTLETLEENICANTQKPANETKNAKQEEAEEEQSTLTTGGRASDKELDWQEKEKEAGGRRCPNNRRGYAGTEKIVKEHHFQQTFPTLAKNAKSTSTANP